MKKLDISLIGGLRLMAGDKSRIPLPTRKAEGLIAFLAAHLGRPQSRSTLADLLWSRSADEQARASLRQELVRLRKALGRAAECLVASAREIRLDGDCAWSDLAELDRLLRSAQPQDLRAAFDLFVEEPLAGFGAIDSVFDEWLADLRNDFALRAAVGFEQLFQSLMSENAFEEAEAVARRITKLDPYSERSRKLLAQTLICMDRRGAALALLDEFAEILRRELGVEPSEDLQRFRGEVAASRPAMLSGPRARPPDIPIGQRLSVAVLPLDVLRDDGMAELFGMGLAEDIATELARFRTLRVIAWHSSRRLDSRAGSAAEIGEELGARYLLRGSMASDGDTWLVRVHLVDAIDGAQVWAERFEVATREIFRAQHRLARRIVGTLTLRIEGEVTEQIRRRPIQDLEPYSLWLRGWDLVKRGSVEADDAARALFERALELDPNFARAYTGLSLSHFNEWSCQYWNQWGKRERLCHRYAARAVELDETDHAANMILGRVLLFRRQFEAAERRIDRSVELNPNDPDCLAQISYAYALLGRAEQSRLCAEEARALNPHCPDWYGTFIAPAYFLTGDPETAAHLAETSPDQFVDTRIFLALTYSLLGDADKARLNGQRFVDNYRNKIAYGCPFGDTDPIRWFFSVNPIRDRDLVNRLWPALKATGIPVPERPEQLESA